MKPFPILGLPFSSARLADADIDRPPRPHAGRDVDPRKCRAVIPGVQEHPCAVEETAETEVSAMFEEVAAHDAAMVKVVVAFVPVTIEVPVIPIGTIV